MRRSATSALLLALPLAAFLGLLGIVISLALLGSSAAGCGAGETVGALSPGVPRRLVPIYEEAAAKYSLGARGPSVLAAINFVETDFGADMATSSAGANGWMAFLPSTWAEWGVDGDGDGRRDPFDPADAIYSAANYLRDSGAPGDWRKAIFAYNHADWYVEKVLRYARRFAGSARPAQQPEAVSGCVPGAPREAVVRMIAEANRLSRLRPQSEYVWGGSHGLSPTPPNGPFDCSSAVSHLLQVGGVQIETSNTVALLEWAEQGEGGELGPGRWVTVFDKVGIAPEHTFIEFMPGLTPPSERFWGTSAFIASGHGPGWIPESTFSSSYLSEFRQLHPAGM